MKIYWDKFLICCDYILQQENKFNNNESLKFFYFTDREEDKKLAKILPHFKLKLEYSSITYIDDELAKEISNFMGWEYNYVFSTTTYNKENFIFVFVDPRLKQYE